MKHLLISLLLMCSASCFAQKADSCYVYAQIKTLVTLSDYASYQIKFGNDPSFHDNLDKEGNKLGFSSLAGVLNYYSQDGWELVQVYDYEFSTTKPIEKIAMIRKKVSVQEAKEQTKFKTKK